MLYYCGCALSLDCSAHEGTWAPFCHVTQVRAKAQQNRGLGAVQFNVYHKTGFELDVWHPDRQLNIELDGPSHRLRSRKHQPQLLLEFLN